MCEAEAGRAESETSQVYRASFMPAGYIVRSASKNKSKITKQKTENEKNKTQIWSPTPAKFKQ